MPFSAIKGIQTGKEEVQLSLFANDMILYIQKTLNNPPQINRIKGFSEAPGYKVNIEKLVAFLYTNNEPSEEMSSIKLMKTVSNTQGWHTDARSNADG